MHRVLLISIFLAIACFGGCEAEDTRQSDVPSATAVVLEGRIVDASCGQCQLGLPGDGCDLAVAFDGNAYYVDGSHIDDHGDAHGSHGLCNVIRLADVSGEIVDGRFVAQSFVLRPMTP